MTQSQSRIDTQFPFADDDIVITQLRLLMRVLELRFQRVETIQEDAEAQAQNLVQIGLTRINEVLLPQVERIQRLTSLGFLIAHSDTGQTLALNAQATFFITDDDERETFTPSPYVAIERAGDVNVRAVAKVLAYDRTVGALSVQVLALYGAQARFTDWVISATPGVSEATRSDMAAAGASAAQSAASALSAAQARADALDARDAAAASAVTAGTRATAAATSATNAGNSATAASNSATAAATSAGQAATKVSYQDEQSLTAAQAERARRNSRNLRSALKSLANAATLDTSYLNSVLRLYNGPFTVTLPALADVTAQDVIHIYNCSNATMTIAQNSADTGNKVVYSSLQFSNTFTLPAGCNVLLQSEGPTWVVIQSSPSLTDTLLTNMAQGLSTAKQNQGLSNLGVVQQALVKAADSAAARAAINAQSVLGFNPVQSQTGPGGDGNSAHTFAITWNGSQPLLSVDGQNLGKIWNDQNVGQNFSVNGYCKLPNGLLFQWGYIPGNAPEDQAVAYPVAMTGVLTVQAIAAGANGGSDALSFNIDQIGGGAFAIRRRVIRAGGTVTGISQPGYWFAVGY